MNEMMEVRREKRRRAKGRKENMLMQFVRSRHERQAGGRQGVREGEKQEN